MANRFTDTDKWKKPWFRKLSPVDKCFWQYLTDNCNHAGIWEVDFELAEVFIGAKLDIDGIKKIFAKQFIELNQGRKWLIRDFVPFQYKKGLNPENRAHASVIAILKKEGAYKGLQRGLQARKDKDKDKDKDKAKDKDKYSDFVFLTAKEHKTLCDLFGEGQAKSLIEKLNNYIGSKGKQYKSHYFTILNWAGKDGIRKQQITKTPNYVKDFKDPNPEEQKKVSELVKSVTEKMGKK